VTPEDAGVPEPSKPGAGYEDMDATLHDAQLPHPPIPAAFKAELVRRGPWVWATRPIVPERMYLFREYVDEASVGIVDDYLAVSHAGHGVNSYGLNYHLVYGPVALFTQNGWGGAYMDPAERRARVAATFACAAQLVAVVEARWDFESPRSAQRLIVTYSDFRSVVWWQVRSFGPEQLARTPSAGDPGELSAEALFADARAVLEEIVQR
jgi:hypothetical protein